MDITFNCQYCGQHLCVDESGAGVTVPCPKCKKSLKVPYPSGESTSQVRLVQSSQNNEPNVPPKIIPPPMPKKPDETVWIALLGIISVVLFLAGAGMILDGLAGVAHEQTLREGSAIRQGVYAVQYGSGFIVVGLSAVLVALMRLIRRN